MNFPTQEPGQPDDTGRAGETLAAGATRPAPDPVPAGDPSLGAGPEPITRPLLHKSPGAPTVLPTAGLSPSGTLPPAASALPSSAPVPAAPGAAKRPRRLRWVALAIVMVLGAGSAAAGAVLLTQELRRHATPAEATAAARQEVASRWRRLTASQIFPSSIRYSDAEAISTTARLVGIAPAASCRSSLDPDVGQVMSVHGCITVLRATFVDASGTLATTLGVAVMPSATAAAKAVAALGSDGTTSGVRAVSFSGTLSDAFGDRQRVEFGAAHTSGPYVFFLTTGYADGRIATQKDAPSDLLVLGSAVLVRVEQALTSHKSPCSMKDIRC